MRGAANHSGRPRARIFSQLVVSGRHGNLCDPAPSSGKARCHGAATVGDGRPRREWLIFHPLPFEDSSVARHECSLAVAGGRGGGNRPDARRVVPPCHRTRFMNHELSHRCTEMRSPKSRVEREEPEEEILRGDPTPTPTSHLFTPKTLDSSQRTTRTARTHQTRGRQRASRV